MSNTVTDSQEQLKNFCDGQNKTMRAPVFFFFCCNNHGKSILCSQMNYSDERKFFSLPFRQIKSKAVTLATEHKKGTFIEKLLQRDKKKKKPLKQQKPNKT